MISAPIGGSLRGLQAQKTRGWRAHSGSWEQVANLAAIAELVEGLRYMETHTGMTRAELLAEPGEVGDQYRDLYFDLSAKHKVRVLRMGLPRVRARRSRKGLRST